MAVMHVGGVRMLMSECGMNVSMGMRLAGWIGIGVVMPMMGIMAVRVRVLHGFMKMQMFMAFGEMEPQAHAHQ